MMLLSGILAGSTHDVTKAATKSVATTAKKEATTHAKSTAAKSSTVKRVNKAASKTEKGAQKVAPYVNHKAVKATDNGARTVKEATN